MLINDGVSSSPYLFAVYLYDLSIEINNIKTGFYIAEVLLNTWCLLMIFARFVQVYVGCKVY